MLADATVARNFAILDWTDQLATLSDGVIRVAHGILGIDVDEPGELDGIRAAFEREALASLAGSREHSEALAAVVGLERFIARRGDDLEVVLPDKDEFALAVRLQDPSEAEWLKSLSVRARRLDAGEAVSVAIATGRGEALATDDDAGRAAYAGLGGTRHLWTLNLVKEAAERELLTEDDARHGYALLCDRYRFWGEPWAFYVRFGSCLSPARRVAPIVAARYGDG